MYEPIYTTGGRRDTSGDETLDWQLRLNDHLAGAFGEQFRNDHEVWSQIVAAWYAFEDAYEAQLAFLATEPSHSIAGLDYLMVWGVLQGMNIQQDGLHHLAEAIGFADIARLVRDNAAVTAARDLRIRIAGHPTRREARPRHGQPVSFHGIVRTRLSLNSFRYVCFEGSAAGRFETVDLRLVVEQHIDAYRSVLRALVQRIDAVAHAEEREPGATEGGF